MLGYDTRTVGGQHRCWCPALIGSALFQQERVRNGGNFALAVRAGRRLDVNVTGLYSKFDADNTNQNFLAWGSRAINNGGTLTNATVAGRHGGGRHDLVAEQRHARTSASCTTRSTASRRRRRASIDFDLGWRPADGWDLHFKVGYTDAEGNTDAQPFVEFGAPATFTYDLRGRAPQVSFANVDPTDPNDMQFIFSSLHQILNDDEEKYGYVDATRELEWGALNSIKFGAKYTDHERDLLFNATTYGGFHVPINTTPASAFAGGPTPGDFLDEISAPGTLDAYWQINKDAVNEHPVRQPDGAAPVLSAAELLGDGEGERRLRHGQSRRRQVARQRRRALREHRPDVGGRPDRRRRLHAESVRQLYADQRRPHLQRLAADGELRVRPQRPVRAACCRRARHGAAGLHGRRTAREPEPRRADRHGRQSERRSVSREPGRRVGRVVSQPGRGGRAGDLLQGHQVVHHRPAGHGVLHRAVGDVAVPAVHGRRA